jgi:Holliday junction resolvasome RuvABC ATP-dependent DNA helicase subunit
MKIKENTMNNINSVEKDEYAPIHLIRGGRGNDNGVRDINVFNAIVGQPEACKKLSFYVGSHSDITPIQTLLFSGSQGLGKSYMAEKVASSLNRRFVEVNCGTIITAKDFVENVLFDRVMGEDDVTLLLDESHKLTPEIETVLLTLLNPNAKNSNILVYKNLRIEYDFRRINTIFATTDAHRMFKPLLNRCSEVYFSLYDNDDLFKILQNYLKDIKITCNKDDLAFACKGRARNCYTLSQNILRYCNMYKISVFGQEQWNEVKSIFDIFAYGLGKQEIELLKLIGKHECLSLNSLAIKMGVNIQNIESEMELRPRELGFIDSGTRGRFLTEEGKKYLRKVLEK